MGRVQLISALIVLAALLSACGSGSSEGSPRKRDDPRPERVSAREAASKPNVIFIYTDDQNLADFKPRYMPRTFRLLADPGAFFSDYVVATPLCCPSRVTYLTGAYPHNSGVFSNPSGYRNLRGKFNTLPVWMRNAGYETAWVGKYLQGYDTYAGNPYAAAPGYDEWHATFEPSYYGYDIADDGERVRMGNRPRDYYTTTMTRIATGLIAQQAKRPRPLFLTVNNLAPHDGSGAGGRCSNVVPPAPRDTDRYAGARVPRTASFNEGDVSDKPAIIRADAPLKPRRIARLDLAYGCRLASLQAVDREVASIYDAVKRAGELSNTVFIFTSDNGILQGQHRIGGKNVPYEEGLRQPLAILAGKRAIDGRARAGDVTQLAANVDLAPTILQLAGARPCARPGNCRKLDGRSLVPLIEGRSPPGFGPRRAILIEGGKGGGDCLYSGIRTAGLSYTVHARQRPDGGCQRNAGSELYDLDGSLTGRADPLQLDNLLSPVTPGSDDPAVAAKLSGLRRRLDELRACSGRSCR